MPSGPVLSPIFSLGSVPSNGATTDVSVAMTAVVSKLRADIAAASSQVEAAGSSWFGADSSADAGRGAVKQASAETDRLDSDLRSQVLTGQLDVSRWQAIADAQEDLLRSVAGYLEGSNGFGAFFQQVVVQSGQDLVTDAKAVGSGLISWGPWVLGIAAVGVGLYLIRPLLELKAHA